MNYLYFSPRTEGSNIAYHFEVGGPWKECFNIKPFTPASGKMYEMFGSQNSQVDGYDSGIDRVPASIRAIPFLANILPVAMCYGATVLVDEIDREFHESFNGILKAFQRFYPELNFSGRIVADKLVDNHIDTPKAPPLALFSGGVDATFTMLGNLALKPMLVCVRGADIYFSKDEDDAWKIIGGANSEVARSFGLNYLEIVSTFKALLKPWVLNERFGKRVKDNWWHGFQHGLGLIGLSAPLAYQLGAKRVYISSSFSFKDKRFGRAASHPSIDESVNFFGCRVTHYDYSVSRQEKVAFIVSQSKLLGVRVPLRVCWQERTGVNCCLCEKCLRTIFAIYSENAEPDNFGFDMSAEKTSEIISLIRSPDSFFRRGLSITWGDTVARLHESKFKDLPHVRALFELTSNRN